MAMWCLWRWDNEWMGKVVTWYLSRWDKCMGKMAMWCLCGCENRCTGKMAKWCLGSGEWGRRSCVVKLPLHISTFCTTPKMHNISTRKLGCNFSLYLHYKFKVFSLVPLTSNSTFNRTNPFRRLWSITEDNTRWPLQFSLLKQFRRSEQTQWVNPCV